MTDFVYATTVKNAVERRLALETGSNDIRIGQLAMTNRVIRSINKALNHIVDDGSIHDTYDLVEIEQLHDRIIVTLPQSFRMMYKTKGITQAYVMRGYNVGTDLHGLETKIIIGW